MPFDWLNLNRKLVLITGACGFVGRTLAIDFARHGCNLILLDTSQDHLDEFKRELMLSCKSISVSVHSVDFESNDYLTSLHAFFSGHNSIDVVVHNAAFVGERNLSGWNTSFDKQSIQTWRRCFDVNINPVFSVTQLLCQLQLFSKHSSIILLSSIYGFCAPRWELYESTSMGNPAAYSASKGAVIQFSKWLAATLAPQIRVNSVSPGGISRTQPQSFKARYVSMTPLARMATEQDVSNAVLFLSSSRSSYITGQNIVVDGGWSI